MLEVSLQNGITEILLLYFVMSSPVREIMFCGRGL